MGLCECSCFSEGGRMVVLWAVVPGRGLGPLQEAAQLNSQKHLPQLEKETSPLAFGVKLAPRHNSTSHLLRLRQEGCQPCLVMSDWLNDSSDTCVGGTEAGDPLIDPVPLSPKA